MADSSPADLEDHLGYWLRMVSNHVSHAFARRLDGMGVTVAEWVVLRELFDRAPAAPSKLADALNLTRGAVSKLADRLEAKSLVMRLADPADGRAHRLELTPAGRALVPELAHQADENERALLGALSIEERQALSDLLHKLVRQLGLGSPPLE